MSRGGDNQQRNAATMLALFALIVVALGLLALTALVLPSFPGILLVVVGFGLFGGFHYLVWGRWLSRRLQAQAGQDEDDRHKRVASNPNKPS